MFRSLSARSCHRSLNTTSSQNLPLTSDATQLLGTLPESLVAMSVRGLDVKLLPVARLHTLGVSGSSLAWHISLCNAIASAEGVDIIPKVSHAVGMPTSPQTRDGKCLQEAGEMREERRGIIVG